MSDSVRPDWRLLKMRSIYLCENREQAFIIDQRLSRFIFKQLTRPVRLSLNDSPILHTDFGKIDKQICMTLGKVFLLKKKLFMMSYNF
jgi:hypothetical protein